MLKSNKREKKFTKRKNSELTEAEWTIMRVVWEKEPCAAGTVQEALEKSRNWAYSTVKTTMDRMVKKGFLETHNIRNLTLFKSLISEIEAKHGEIRKTMKRAFNNALTPMMQFLLENENFSESEMKQLRKIVNKVPGKKEKV